jgi:hypothetical protein
MTMMRAFGQMINVNLPDLGEGTKEATVKEILVKVGQRVEEVRYQTTNLNDFRSTMTYAKCSLTSS